MNSSTLATLIPVLVALIVAVTAYLKSRTAVSSAQQAAKTAQFATAHSVAVSGALQKHVDSLTGTVPVQATPKLEGHVFMSDEVQQTPAIDGATLMGIVPPVPVEQPAQVTEAQPAQEPVPAAPVTPAVPSDPATDPLQAAKQALLDAANALEKIAQTF